MGKGLDYPSQHAGFQLWAQVERIDLTVQQVDALKTSHAEGSQTPLLTFKSCNKRKSLKILYVVILRGAF